jgi:hypothetical protein
MSVSRCVAKLKKLPDGSRVCLVGPRAAWLEVREVLADILGLRTKRDHFSQELDLFITLPRHSVDLGKRSQGIRILRRNVERSPIHGYGARAISE